MLFRGANGSEIEDYVARPPKKDSVSLHKPTQLAGLCRQIEVPVDEEDASKIDYSLDPEVTKRNEQAASFDSVENSSAKETYLIAGEPPGSLETRFDHASGNGNELFKHENELRNKLEPLKRTRTFPGSGGCTIGETN